MVVSHPEQATPHRCHLHRVMPFRLGPFLPEHAVSSENRSNGPAGKIRYASPVAPPSPRRTNGRSISCPLTWTWLQYGEGFWKGISFFFGGVSLHGCHPGRRPGAYTHLSKLVEEALVFFVGCTTSSTRAKSPRQGLWFPDLHFACQG